METQTMQDKTVVVIGGSSGMGLAAAQFAARAGARVVIGGRDQAKLQQAVATLDGSAGTYPVDLTKDASVTAFFAQVGAFDHLVVTGSSPGFAPLSALSIERAQDEFGQKFWGQFRAVQQAVPNLRAGGSVVLMSGGYSLRPDRGSLVMAAANGAIESLTRALAVELSPLRINAVAPGLVTTPLIDVMVPDAVSRAAMYEQVGANLLTRRVAQPDDVGQAILFLLTNPHMTGTTLRIDGGVTLF